MNKASILENKNIPKTEINNVPAALKQKNLDKNTSEGPTIDKANDILKQINEYIDKEKKDLK